MLLALHQGPSRPPDTLLGPIRREVEQESGKRAGEQMLWRGFGSITVEENALFHGEHLLLLVLVVVHLGTLRQLSVPGLGGKRRAGRHRRRRERYTGEAGVTEAALPRRIFPPERSRRHLAHSEEREGPALVPGSHARTGHR